MADNKPQEKQNPESNRTAPSVPEDYYATLTKVINDVTADHAMLRKLVYALAWQNLKPETIITKPVATATSQAKTIVELEQAVQLERAIQRIEVEESRGPQDARPRVAQPSFKKQDADPSSSEVGPEPAIRTNSLAETELLSNLTAPSEVSPTGAKDLDALLASSNSKSKNSTSTGEIERDPQLEALDASFEPPLARGSVVLLPEPARVGEKTSQTQIVQLERIPSWLDPKVRIALDAIEYEPVRQLHQQRSHFVPFFQLIAASVIGVVLYIGISGWVYIGRQGAFAPAPAPMPQPQMAVAPPPEAPVSESQTAAAKRSEPEPQPILPFPLPRSYGVYAGVPGKLFELEQLPIKAPDPRVLVSAEITKPSSVTMPGADVTFVVFRRDLVNSAPPTASVRVVARVQRTTKYVDGKPSIVPLQGTWRIRSKEYVFKVSPLEGHNEMLVIQPNPGFVFQPGRYALVLNGFGYDFNVEGKVSAPEQCLEQVEVVNGAVLTECPKT